MRPWTAAALLLPIAALGLATGLLSRGLLDSTVAEHASSGTSPNEGSRRSALRPEPPTPHGNESASAPSPPPARSVLVPALVGGVYTQAEVAAGSTASLTASRNAGSTLERRALTRIAGSDDGTSLVDCAGSEALPPSVVVELHVVSEPSRVAITDIRVLADDVPGDLSACISGLAAGLEERAAPAVQFLRGDAWVRREILLPHGRN